MKYVDNLFDWAVGVYDEFCNDSYRIEEAHDYETGVTIVYDLKTGKSAFSKCRKNEEFSEEIGVAVAYTRLKGREVPQVRQKVFVKYLTAGNKFSLSGMPNVIYNVVGVNPIKPTEMIAVCAKDGKLFRFDFYNEVNKLI